MGKIESNVEVIILRFMGNVVQWIGAPIMVTVFMRTSFVHLAKALCINVLLLGCTVCSRNALCQQY